MNIFLRSTLTAIVIILVSGVWNVGASAATNEQVRQELMDFMALQQAYLEYYEDISGKKPRFDLRLQSQMNKVLLMPSDQLTVLAEAQIDLRDINTELSSLLQELEWYAKSTPAPTKSVTIGVNVFQSPQSITMMAAAATAGASHLGAGCPADQKIDDFLTLLTQPPGYCNQTDDIPVSFGGTADPAGAVSEEFRLSDVGYPFVCPINTPTIVLARVRLGFYGLRTANHILGKACQQEISGFNTSTACVWVAPALGLLETIIEDIGACNGERRDSERNTLYARTGEIYVQGNAHYSALGQVDGFTKTAVTELDTNLGSGITATGNEVSAELDSGFGEIADQVDLVERQVQENAVKTDFVRLNNETIEYKIWCDKQRPDLRPSNCQ